MSAAGIQIATTTPNTLVPAAIGEDDGSNDETTTANVTDCASFAQNQERNSSFCTLPSLKEQQSSLHSELYNNKVPLENGAIAYLAENKAENAQKAVSDKEYSKNGERLEIESTLTTQLSPGLSLLQQTASASSPPPHSYRHSRAYRHFKNPPQPHMCIRTTTESGEELFINVLSWTRIVIPQEPSDPIPLYGGMRVPPGSPRSPPIVFAVMANPEVLKDSGRHSKDPEERRAMVELMCDFVEAMNPGVKLVRSAIILKNRDISGELKDVWNAVQAQRDREREEQMLLQRQQHQNHFHNSNASTNGSVISSTLTSINNSANAMATTQQMFSKSLNCTDDAMLMTVDGETSPSNRKIIYEVQNDTNASNIDLEKAMKPVETNIGQEPLVMLAEHWDKKMSTEGDEQTDDCRTKQQKNQNAFTKNALSTEKNSKDLLEIEGGKINNQQNGIICNKNLQKQQPTLTNGCVINCNATDVPNIKKATAGGISNPPAQTPPKCVAPSSTAQQVPTKKEKLGFLPNGCIFPRFTKNNKHKDKDKEPKTKEKEKNVLLSALKKSKDKKSSATAAAAVTATAANTEEKLITSFSKTSAANCNQTINKQQKNCLQQLESGVQKMDLNNHLTLTRIAEINTNNSTVNIAANKNATSTSSNSGGVGVR